MALTMNSFEYLILGGAFLTILMVGCIAIMAYVISVTKTYRKFTESKMKEIDHLARTTIETQRELIAQLKILNTNLKK